MSLTSALRSAKDMQYPPFSLSHCEIPVKDRDLVNGWGDADASAVSGGIAPWSNGSGVLVGVVDWLDPSLLVSALLDPIRMFSPSLLFMASPSLPGWYGSVVLVVNCDFEVFLVHIWREGQGYRVEVMLVLAPEVNERLTVASVAGALLK
jgi:hypothetical protein